MNLTRLKYIPTIFVRQAEIRALRELPGVAKDRLTPIFCLRPWPNAKRISLAVERMEEALGNRPYFMDVDHFIGNLDQKKPAHSELGDLIEDVDGFSNWMSFFSEHSNAYPCLRIEGKSTSITTQIDYAKKLGKTFLVRFNFGEVYDPVNISQIVCQYTDHSDFGFVVDVGWGRDILSRYSWADSIIKMISSIRGDSIPIVISGSSFPRDFTVFDYEEAVEATERVLFRKLQAANNSARLIYGDWASSRSPLESGGGGTPPPRIDLPTPQSWIVFRESDAVNGFESAATSAMANSAFPRDVKIWSTMMIDATSKGEANGIKHARMAAAVRINLPLFNQLFYEDWVANPNTDDDFIE
jgi:hypothetical protein